MSDSAKNAVGKYRKRMVFGMSDLISREAAIKTINDNVSTIAEKTFYDCLLYRIPSVDAVPVVHGKWVNVIGGFFEMGRCSVCGGQWPTAGGLNFCPNCGAKMDESIADLEDER